MSGADAVSPWLALGDEEMARLAEAAAALDAEGEGRRGAVRHAAPGIEALRFDPARLSPAGSIGPLDASGYFGPSDEDLAAGRRREAEGRYLGLRRRGGESREGGEGPHPGPLPGGEGEGSGAGPASSRLRRLGMKALAAGLLAFAGLALAIGIGCALVLTGKPFWWLARRCESAVYWVGGHQRRNLERYLAAGGGEHRAKGAGSSAQKAGGDLR